MFKRFHHIRLNNFRQKKLFLLLKILNNIANLSELFLQFFFLLVLEEGCPSSVEDRLSEMSFCEAPGFEQRDLLVETSACDDRQSRVHTERNVLLSKLNYWMIKMVQPCNKMFY